MASLFSRLGVPDFCPMNRTGLDPVHRRLNAQTLRYPMDGLQAHQNGPDRAFSPLTRLIELARP